MSLYHEAAEILTAPASDGGSLKSRVFRKNGAKSPPSQLYAVVLETSKWSPILKQVVERSELLKHERKLTPALSLLLVHDMLLAKEGVALPRTHGLRMGVERHKNRLSAELRLAQMRRKAPSLNDLREEVERDSAGEEAAYPRWVRINILKSTLEDQLDTTFSSYARVGSIKDLIASAEKHYLIDPHVPNLIAVTPRTDLTKTEAYTSGKIILQDKASCFPAYLLDPRSEDGDVVDACAAPGNKTTHLAAILREHRPEFEAPQQTIYAFEKDAKRANTLDKMIRIAGCKAATRVGFGQDFLQVDPRAEKFRRVGALLLDPSCSGSGIVGRDSMPELHLPEAPGKKKKAGAAARVENGGGRKRKIAEVAADETHVIRDDDGNETILKREQDVKARLDALAAFQLELVLHAFKFPAATKITYSTCSVHAQENEGVVMRALQSDIARSRGWQIIARREQVSGMKEWPVRGLLEACQGQDEVAEGCLRTYKDDGRGVMGFFVAGFVRRAGMGDGAETATTAEGGPYLRDEDGVMVRDPDGMPLLKSTGRPVTMIGREDSGNEDDDDDISDDGSSESSDDGSGDDADMVRPAAEDTSNHRKDAGGNDGDGEWEGFGD